MKPTDWLNILKESQPWIILLCISDAFFIFLAWVAYPETFRLLVGIMITFSFTVIVLGMILAWKRQEKQDRAFYDFLENPAGA